MSRLMALSIQMVARPFQAVARRRRDRASVQHAIHDDPEQLERIATYARAGYFNMGYTFEMFPLVGDLPPS